MNNQKSVSITRRRFLNRNGLTSAQISINYNEYEWTATPEEYTFINITNGYSSCDLDLKEFDKLVALVEAAKAAFKEKLDATK